MPWGGANLTTATLEMHGAGWATSKKERNAQGGTWGAYGQFGDTVGQARCLIRIAEMFHLEGLLDAAEETVPRASELLREADNQRLPCECNSLLVRICLLRYEGENAIDYYQTVRGITSSRGRPDGLPFAHFGLAFAFWDQQRFDDATTHFVHAGSDVRDNLLLLGTMVELQAFCRYYQGMFDEARSGASRAIDIFGVRT